MILSQDDDDDADVGKTTSVNVPTEFSEVRWKRRGNNGEHMKIYGCVCVARVRERDEDTECECERIVRE